MLNQIHAGLRTKELIFAGLMFLPVSFTYLTKLIPLVDLPSQTQIQPVQIRQNKK